MTAADCWAEMSLLPSMVVEKLPKDLLKTLVRETPFTTREIVRLWNRFQAFNTDSAGTISSLVRHHRKIFRTLLPAWPVLRR